MSKRNSFYAPHLRIPCCVATADGWTGATLKVYTELARRSRYGNRKAYGGRISLAAACGIHEDTARRALRRLEQAGAIVKKLQSWGGRGIANVYELVRHDWNSLRRVGHHVSQTALAKNPFSKGQKWCKAAPPSTHPTDGINNRPPNASAWEAKAADYRDKPPPETPIETSENANWDAIGKNLQLLSETKWSIP